MSGNYLGPRCMSPCDHGMKHLRVTIARWRVAANVLGKHSRTADKWWISILGVGRGVNDFSPYKNSQLTKCYTGPQNWRAVWTR